MEPARAGGAGVDGVRGGRGSRPEGTYVVRTTGFVVCSGVVWDGLFYVKRGSVAGNACFLLSFWCGAPYSSGRFGLARVCCGCLALLLTKGWLHGWGGHGVGFRERVASILVFCTTITCPPRHDLLVSPSRPSPSSFSLLPRLWSFSNTALSSGSPSSSSKSSSLPALLNLETDAWFDWLFLRLSEADANKEHSSCLYPPALFSGGCLPALGPSTAEPKKNPGQRRSPCHSTSSRPKPRRQGGG